MDHKRIFQLDVLRGFAILLVMGVHVPAYPIWSTIGGWGVDLFFVLSGFLISNLLFTEYRNRGAIRLSRFFFRRALKLYPSFYLLLGLTLVYCFVDHVHFSGRELLGEMTLTQNYVGAIWGHTWSLAVEEHFYIVLPLILAFMMWRNKGSENPFHAIPYVFLGVAIACLTLRLVNSYLHPIHDHHIHYQPSHLRADSLFFGVFLSYLHNFRQPILKRLMSNPWRFPVSAISVLALAPACFLPTNDPFVYTFGFTFVYIGFGTMLLLSIYQEEDRKRPAPGMATRAIAWMGTYSYTLYLWHVPMAQVFGALARRYGMVNQYLLHAIYFLSTLAVAVMLSKLVEMPVLKLRERLFPSPISEKREEPPGKARIELTHLAELT
jgi:peptidoglycan/LPS O-acetylase OafA/YrhL